MVSIHDLSFSYQGQKEVLHFPNLQFKSNNHYLILGKSGTGKSTLLSMMAGLLPVKKGNIIVNEVDITQLSEKKLDMFRGQNIGLVFQSSHFIQSINVQDNLRLAQTLGGNKVSNSKINHLLKQLDLFQKIKSKPKLLSQGEQQRLAIARAVINSPTVIFADEPTSALDDENAKKVVDLLKKHADEVGGTLIIVTHDQRLKSDFDHQITLN